MAPAANEGKRVSKFGFGMKRRGGGASTPPCAPAGHRPLHGTRLELAVTVRICY